MLSRNYLSLLLLSGLLLNSCAGPSVATQEPVTESAETVAPVSSYTFDFDIDALRITPDAIFYTRDNQIPAVFQVDQSGLSEAQRNAGFRVQIISTSDVRLAENVQREFNTWLGENLPNYDPETYIQFRQPFYRLHVGNFFSRSDAIEFNNIIKRRFPDAWVVHDIIDPDKLTRIQISTD